MGNMIKISKEEYDVLMEQKHKCLSCQKMAFYNFERVEDIYSSREQLKKQMAEKNETIERCHKNEEGMRKEINRIGEKCGFVIGERDQFRVLYEERGEELEELKKQLAEKNEEIEKLNETVERQNKILTEKEMYEDLRKAAFDYINQETDNERIIKVLCDNLCRLEAHITAQENPHFF